MKNRSMISFAMNTGVLTVEKFKKDSLVGATTF